MYRCLVAVFFIGKCCFADPQNGSFLPLFPCQCVKTDTVPMEEFLISTLNRVLTGKTCSPNRMDPLLIEHFESDFATFRYNDTNNTVTGLSESKITFLKVSDDIEMVAFKLDIPSFLLEGPTNYTGYILYLTGHGDGHADIIYGRTLMKIYAQLVQVNGSNDCKYLQFGNFSMNPQSLSPFRFNVTPIYGDCNEDETNQRNHFMDENWEDMAYFCQAPLMNSIVQKLLTFCNEYLINIRLNNLLDCYNINRCPNITDVDNKS